MSKCKTEGEEQRWGIGNWFVIDIEMMGYAFFPISTLWQIALKTFLFFVVMEIYFVKLEIGTNLLQGIVDVGEK